jgi:two-component system, chemotaxis family, chemotaxis protein CheY
MSEPDGAAARTVLIVEDDEAVRESLAEVLELEGYQALQAANGKEALSLLRSSPRPDLILLDLVMPVMSGWQVLGRLRGTPALSSIPVLVLSSPYGPPPEGAVGGCIKPYPLDDLLALIRRHLTQRGDTGKAAG